MVRAGSSPRRFASLLALLIVVAMPSVARAQDAEAASSPSRLAQWRTSFVDWRKDAGPMFPLYSGFATLQMLDVNSTSRAIGNGAIEQNAMLSGVANHAAALTLVKMGTTAATVYGMESLRKKHRVAAIAAMVGLDSLYSMIVVHNYRAGTK